MKEEEFNLSEKIIIITPISYAGTSDEDVIAVDDVKEFIRRLKEILEDTKGSSWIVQESLIDKLAGKELSK